MYEFAKINVREIFCHNRIEKINVRKIFGDNQIAKINEKFSKIDFFLQNKAIFMMFLENFFRFQPIFENFLDFGGFNTRENNCSHSRK